MEPRVTLITLGVASVAESRAFYERLGWRAAEASQEGVAFFQLGPVVLSLFGRAALAADAEVADTPPGFAAVSLAQNLSSIAAVDAAYAAALAAGATPLKTPCTAFWGGYSGYFADPDGFCWELAYNPFFPLDGAGQILPAGVSTPVALPRWADLTLVPLLSVAAAFVVAAIVVVALGVDPWTATLSMVRGSLGSSEGLGFTLYYATDFIFTGLAVSLAFQAGLFNIGAEGQAYMGGLGAALVCLHGGSLPSWLLIPAGIAGAAALGGLWGYIPGLLQAKRGSHIVITTIMFNWLATTLMAYLLVNTLREPTSMQPGTARFPDASVIPSMDSLLARFGIVTAETPLNLSFLLALVAALAVWVFVWRTRTGYEIRTVGANATAALYGGIAPSRIVILTMTLSGALAAGVAVNEIMGVQSRVLLEFTSGYGFVGIAVALMGRAHPVGVVLASFLFGMLYQGGAELAFDEPKITRDMIVVIQGFVVLFAGALEGLFRRPVALGFSGLVWFRRSHQAAE